MTNSGKQGILIQEEVFRKMPDLPACSRCGVPELFNNSYTWLPSGVIVQKNAPDHRMVIMDCDNIDPFFRKIEEIIGQSIESIIIETKMKETRDYLRGLIPEETREMVRDGQLDLATIIELINTQGHVMGYGDSQLADVRFEQDDDDFLIERIQEPYSILLFSGDVAGACEVITSRGFAAGYQEFSPGLYEVKAWPSYEPRKMRVRPVEERPLATEGGVTLEQCPECGSPAALFSHHWDIGKGQIVTEETGRRIAILGPDSMETIFHELVMEFGEEIPRTIVEAQRRFTRKGIYTVKEMGEGDSFRQFLALRGLGDMEEIKLRRNGLEMRLRNPALSLILAGILQGYYEDVTGQESDIEWQFDEDGTFEMKVTARA